MTLRAALGYASMGIGVLPIAGPSYGTNEAASKQPIGRLARHGVKDATTDSDTIREWWTDRPLANVAIAVAPEWFVVDVDPRNQGNESLAELVRVRGALPPTITQRSGSGGTHLLFARPDGVRLRGKLARGIDLLSVGRYIVAAPSLHWSGERYKWISPKATKIAQPPPWLVELACIREAPLAPATPSSIPRLTLAERARQYLDKCEPAISGSAGHTVTFLVAQKLVRGFELDDETAYALLAEWNQTCKPPWSERELRHKIKQARCAGGMQFGALANARRGDA